MWHALFLAIGVFLIIVGIECLGVETVTLKLHDDPPAPTSSWDTPATVGPAKVLKPAGWTPWSFMATGAVVCLYSFTIPRRVKGQ